MKLHHLAGVGLAALLAIGSVQVAAIADARHDARLEKKAAAAAKTASKAIAKKRWDKAIAAAESAVALAPDDAGYRTILGSAYLRAGRFASAETAYRDALTLRPDDGRVALNLALAQIATGKWAEARAVLDRHADAIPAADRGLALALAGDPAAAVTVLTAATRTAEADAKTRQNLALAMALSGEWQQARTLIGLDLAPVDADKRIIEWAAFARPQAASDQVAALLGVKPVTDPGQPVSLALAASVPVNTAAAPVEAFMPGAPAPEVVAAAVEPSRGSPVEVAVMPAAVPVPFVNVVAPRKVASGSRAALITAPIPYKTAIVGARQRKPAAASMLVAHLPAKGDWVVQLGAFENAAVARDGWKRATRRFAALSDHQPGGMSTSLNGASFYRLSVGGFARTDAVALCRSYRAKGGTCFVRQQAGDRLAAWAQAKGVELASR
jgi:Flp pilus assembly protein TadD